MAGPAGSSQIVGRRREIGRPERPSAERRHRDLQRNDPDFELPEQFLQLLVRVKPILDKAWPLIEQRYRAIQAAKPIPASLTA
jgi:hypothetical protein